MIFIAVGSLAPFDRLVLAADGLASRLPGENWSAQIADGTFEPRHMAFDRFLNKSEFDEKIHCADLIIGHAGVGIISAAVYAGKPLLVLPRMACFGEAVNDHQVETASFYAKEGYLLAASNADELSSEFDRLQHFVPKRRTAQPERVATRVADFLRSIAES